MADVQRGVEECPQGDAPGLRERLLSLRARLERELWHLDPAEPVTLRLLRSAAQLTALTIRGFQSDQLLLRASSLTYITALSVIPMLAVIFAILGMVGGNDTLVDFAIDQLTTVAPEVRETVRGYVGGLDLAGFGTFGGAIFFGTAIFALRHLETTLNDIWGVAASRNWARRFSDYLAVMVVAPISTGLAVSLATTFQNETALGRLLENPGFAKIHGLGLAQVPLLFLFLGFTFLYWFFPNTTVRIRSAALGGILAAVLFSAAREVYVGFQVGAATYQAVFGALSAIPLILAWLYACWAIVLLGAEIAFAAQNLGSAAREMRAGVTSPAEREAVALEIAVAIGRAFAGKAEPPSAETLADELDEPVRNIRRLLEELEGASLLRRVVPLSEGDATYVPARPLVELSVGDVLRAVRGEVPGDSLSPGAGDSCVITTLDRLEAAWGAIADQSSLESLVRGDENGSPEPHA